MLNVELVGNQSVRGLIYYRFEDHEYSVAIPLPLRSFKRLITSGENYKKKMCYISGKIEKVIVIVRKIQIFLGVLKMGSFTEIKQRMLKDRNF